MPFNQLLLVLLGGFIFVSQWRRTKYYTRRVDGHRLILFSACAGVIFLLIAVVIDVLLAERLHGIADFWRQHVSYPHTGKTFIAFILGATLWYPLNYFHVELTQIERVLLKLGGPFEILLANTMSRRLLVMLKVKNDNIYVGYINRNFNPTVNPASLEMTVVMRGYSDKDTKDEVFDRFYLTPDELKKHPLPFETLTVAIPVAEVESAHLFDAAEYARRFAQRRSSSPVEPPSERPPYENFGAQDHFQLGQQYLLRGDTECAGEQIVQAAVKDHGNADYRFFLALVRSLQIILGNDYFRVIHYAMAKKTFAWYVQAAQSYDGPSPWFKDLVTAEYREFDLSYFEKADVFELLFDALVGDPVKYKDAIRFILDITEEVQKEPKNGRVVRTKEEPYTNEEMNAIEAKAKESLIEVIHTCLRITDNDPRYYQFLALALLKSDRIIEIDLLAEKLIQKGEWEMAEAVYELPLKHEKNEHLQTSLARVKQRVFPLERI
jgi:hypothetical protein